MLALLGLGNCAAPSDSQTTSSDGDGSTSTTGPGGTDAENTGSGACTPTLEGIRTGVFEPSCTIGGCHDATTAAGSLDLASEGIEARLVGREAGTCEGWIRVVPGAPDASLLYTKVAGPVPCGEKMPIGGELSNDAIVCIEDWIAGISDPGCETCGTMTCVDTSSDVAHCGECDLACPAGVPCIDAACMCPNGGTVCGAACVDTDSDPAHCGACDQPCDASQVCLQGTCADNCGDATECDGACVDTQTNPDHCGRCSNPCGAGVDCLAGECACAGPRVSFATDIAPILTGQCAGMGCHSFPAPKADLDLSAQAAYDELVGVPSTQCNNRLLVAPGDVAGSYLMDKLLGVNLCFGSQMPKQGQSLPGAQIDAISSWICSGAAND